MPVNLIDPYDSAFLGSTINNKSMKQQEEMNNQNNNSDKSNNNQDCSNNYHYEYPNQRSLYGGTGMNQQFINSSNNLITGQLYQLCVVPYFYGVYYLVPCYCY